MKDYKIISAGDYYEVKYGDEPFRKYRTYEESVNDIYKYYKKFNIKTMDKESESELEARLRREKANKRNNKIDQILS